MTTRDSQLAEALARLRSRLARAAVVAGRDAEHIELLPVTKFFPASDVLVLYGLGCTDFGESREQEASKKVDEVAGVLVGQPIRWHMVGRIQRNKVRGIAGWAYSVHSADSARLIRALDRATGEAIADGLRSTPLRVYLQISLDGDTERGGVDVRQPGLVDELCAAVDGSPALELAGLMGIPPLDWNPVEAYSRLQAEHDRVQRDYPQRLGLSAGMSEDLEVAIQHGSTCVRVGTALMGQRPLTSPEVVTPVTSSSHTPQQSEPSEGSRDEHTA